jgi:hypothetical protein
MRIIRTLLVAAVILIGAVIGIKSIAYSASDICTTECGCLGCPPGQCWVCCTIGSNITCYKTAPKPT